MSPLICELFGTQVLLLAVSAGDAVVVHSDGRLEVVSPSDLVVLYKSPDWPVVFPLGQAEDAAA